MRALGLLLLTASLAITASAQPATDWATLTPGAGPAVPLADGFDEMWRGGTGASGRVEAPLYGGRVRAGLFLTEYESTAEDIPEFWLLVPTLGWGPAVEVGPVRLAAGGRLGAAQFRFDDDEAGNFQNETELAVGAWAGGGLQVGRVEVWAEAEATRLTLSTPTTLLVATGGLAIRLDTPRWARAVLR